MTISNILMIIMLALVIAQFFFEGIAQEINARFKELGYEIKANPMWSLFAGSNFWSEARAKNSELQDLRISKLLLYRTVWLALVILTLLGIFISGE